MGATGMKYSPNSGFGNSLSAATTGTGTGFSMVDCREVWGSLTGSGTVTGGTAVFEANPVGPDYSGTWFTLDSITFSTTPLTGSAYETVRFAGTYAATRWRISSNVTGGGSITAICNGLLG